MCCYVGKATKIFLCIVSALLVAGLVLGFGLAHRTWGARRAQPVACRWPRCPPEPLPYATAPPSVPLTEPAVAAFPGAASSTATTTTTPSVPLTEPAVAAFPGVASSTAAPPPSSLTEPVVAAFPGVASSTAAPPPNSLTEPAVAAFPGVASSTAAPPPNSLTEPASSFAAPPATTSLQYYGPPSPFAVGLGPSSHA